MRPTARLANSTFVDVGAFLVGGALLAVACGVTIPHLVRRGVEPLLAWFAAGAALVFVPLLLMGTAILRAEGTAWSSGRLRLTRPTQRDWIVVALGVVFVVVTTSALALVVRRVLGGDLAPPFLRATPLGPGRWWILVAWLPFWVLNVLSEEFLWRAVVLPRQEVRHGRRAWMVQALLWSVFHVAFGPTVLLLALPCIVTVPYVAQRTQSTWTAVVIHALSNGPPFVLIALGVGAR